MRKKIIVQGRPYTFSISGNRTFTTNFIPHLSRRLKDYDFEILVPGKPNLEYRLEDNCTFIVIDPIKTVPDYLGTILWENVQIVDYINNQKEEGSFFLSTHHSIPISKLNIPEFLILHDVHLWYQPDPRWAMERKLAYEISKKGILNTDIIFSVSNFTKKEIEKCLKIKRIPIKVIYESTDNYYDKDQLLNPEEIEKKFDVEKDNYFLYVGSFEVRKNIGSLIEAYKEYLKRSDKKKQLLIIGEDTERSKSLGCFDMTGVKNFSKASLEELYNLYKFSSAFIYPSLYEGFGLQILEAQRTGCPLLISDIEIFHEIAGDGALFFDPNNSKDIAQKMLLVEKDEILRKNIIVRGKNNEERFGWNLTIDRFIEGIEARIEI